MTDLQITRLCARAMGWHTGEQAKKVVCFDVKDSAIIAGNDQGGESVYDPLNDDGQAMALFNKFKLFEAIRDGSLDLNVENPNRAMCEFVANMQATSARRAEPAGRRSTG